MTAGGLLLGVDGGGTKTRALLADRDGTVLATGVGPTSNHWLVGAERAAQAIAAAADEALARLAGDGSEGVNAAALRGRIVAGCLGLSGGDRPSDLERMARAIEAQGFTTAFSVVHDSELVLAAGTPEGWGLGLISGTGSACFGRSADGRTARVGGWGHLLGDEGSGYSIGYAALKLATQAADGRNDAREILAAVLDCWKLADADDLFAHAYNREVTQAEVAGLAAPVLALAASGDRYARRLLDEAAAALALHVVAVARKLQLRRAPVALAGGLLCRSDDLREALRAALGTDWDRFTAVEDPALGAIKLAGRLLDAATPGDRASVRQ